MFAQLVFVILYAWNRSSRHAKLIQNGMWIGHGRTFEGKEYIAAGMMVMLGGTLYHVFLAILMGLLFSIWLNQKRGLRYNYVGVMEDGGGIGKEDSTFDIIMWKYFYPYHIILGTIATASILFLHLYFEYIK